MSKKDEFDFLNNPTPEVKTATSGNPKPKPVKPVFGTLTPKIIAEARAARGLDIEKFYKKYGLSIPVEKLLLGPLDEQGNLK